MTGHTASEANSDFQTINLTVELDFQDGDTTSPFLSFEGKTHPFPVTDMAIGPYRVPRHMFPLLRRFLLTKNSTLTARRVKLSNQ